MGVDVKANLDCPILAPIWPRVKSYLRPFKGVFFAIFCIFLHCVAGVIFIFFEDGSERRQRT